MGRCAVMSTPFWKKEISETKMKFVEDNKMHRRERLMAKMKLRSVVYMGGFCGSGAEA
jgi:hypothetical protein